VEQSGSSGDSELARSGQLWARNPLISGQDRGEREEPRTRTRRTGVAWPSALLLVRALGAGWLIFAAWAALGALLAVLSRGTSLAIGIGIVYALLIERLLSALASNVGVLDHLAQFFLRANGYSLVTTVGVSPKDISDLGPGSFSGPFISGGQALLTLSVYLVVLLAGSGWLLRRRDVT
jgi:ABC-2 type transport system permease protein